MKTRLSSALKAVSALALTLGIADTAQAALPITGFTEEPTLWLDASVGVSAPATGGSVVSWTDQAALGGAIVLNPSATAPQWVPDAFPSVTGNQSAVTFGPNSWMTADSVLGSALFGGTGTADSDSTVFIVQNMTLDPVTSAQTTTFAWFGPGTSFDQQQFAVNAPFSSSGSVDVYFGHGPSRVLDATPGPAGVAVDTGAPIVSDTFQVLGFQRNGANADFRYNGVSRPQTAVFTGAGNPEGTGVLTLGAARPGEARFVGDIAEVIVFGSALEADQIAQVEQYLGNKYGLTVVPEPSTYAAIFALACLGAAAAKRYRRSMA